MINFRAEKQKFEQMINQIILGDCLEVMKKIPDKSVDLILTDPHLGKLL